MPRLAKPTHKESFFAFKEQGDDDSFPSAPNNSPDPLPLLPPFFSFTSRIVASSCYLDSGTESLSEIRLNHHPHHQMAVNEKFAFNAPTAISVWLTAHTPPAQIGSLVRGRGVCCMAMHCTCVLEQPELHYGFSYSDVN